VQLVYNNLLTQFCLELVRNKTSILYLCIVVAMRLEPTDSFFH